MNDTIREQSTAAVARARRDKPDASSRSKTDLVLQKLRTAKGATTAQLGEITGWQSHSVRGFLSGTVKKKLGLTLVSESGKDGTRRYRVLASTEPAHPVSEPVVREAAVGSVTAARSGEAAS